MKKFSIVLFVLVLFSVFGFVALNASVGNEEIGSPIVDKELGYIESAILTSNGKNFYTLKNGIISFYQISPLKKHYSFPIKINSNVHNIYITNNNRKMVIASNDELILLNLQTQEIINHLKYKSQFRVMSGINFITINKDKVVTVWDTQKLNKIKYYILDDSCSKIDCDDGYHYFSDIAQGVFKVMNRLIYISTHSISILESKTLETIKKINKDMTSYVILRANNKSLHIQTQKHDINICTGKNIEAVKGRGDLQLSKYKFRNISIKKSIRLICVQDSTFLRIGKHQYKLYQFNNGDLIIYRSYLFEATSPIVKKYMKMKIEDGKVIPMNDATFNKYNKTISIGEKR